MLINEVDDQRHRLVGSGKTVQKKGRAMARPWIWIENG
jgi:hypothetical protein